MKQASLDDNSKLLLVSSRIHSLITTLQAASGDVSQPIRRFVNFIDQAPPSLVQDFLDVPELQSIWVSLLKKHSELWSQWKQKPLPHFSVFNQLVGYYRYCLALTDALSPEERLKELHKAMLQGSINAMIAVGDSYIEKIQTNEINVLDENIIKEVKLFANLFLTPGHIIAADIYLAIWAKAVSIHTNFHQAIYHLALAELSLKDSGPHINNAYSAKDFRSASEDGKVFRSEEYKGHSVAKNMESNLNIFKKHTGVNLSLKPIIDRATIEMTGMQTCEEKQIKVSDEKSKPVKLRLFFQTKLQTKPDSELMDYLLKTKF